MPGSTKKRAPSATRSAKLRGNKNAAKERRVAEKVIGVPLPLAAYEKIVAVARERGCSVASLGREILHNAVTSAK